MQTKKGATQDLQGCGALPDRRTFLGRLIACIHGLQSRAAIPMCQSGRRTVMEKAVGHLHASLVAS